MKGRKMSIAPARCDRCKGLFLIRGKDPGTLKCHYCEKDIREGKPEILKPPQSEAPIK